MEYYHMTKNKYVRQIRKDGLQPTNGEQSKSIGDAKKAVFYSQGKEGAVVMYLSFRQMYNDLKGQRGDKTLIEYMNYVNGNIELSEDQALKLEEQVKEIRAIRSTETFFDYYNDGPYFSIQDLETEDIKDKNFNFANSWVTKGIKPEQLQVMALRSKSTGEKATSKFDVIQYFMSQVPPESISDKVNDKLGEFIKRYYEEHSEEIKRKFEDYTLETMSLDEYAEMLENEQARQGNEELTGQIIGKGLLEQIRNTRKIEETARQISGNEKSDSAREIGE